MIVKIEFKLLYCFISGKRWKDNTNFGLFFDELQKHTSYDDPNMQIGDIVGSWTGSLKDLQANAFRIQQLEVEIPFDPDANIWTRLIPTVSA